MAIMCGAGNVQEGWGDSFMVDKDGKAKK
jgi:hypothetical protein